MSLVLLLIQQKRLFPLFYFGLLCFSPLDGNFSVCLSKRSLVESLSLDCWIFCVAD